MKDIERHWLVLVEKVKVLTIRERLIVFAALLIGVYGIWDLFGHGAYRKENRQLLENIASEKTKHQQLEVSIVAVLAKSKVDPDQGSRERLEALRQVLQSMEVRKEELARSFIHPGKLSELLRGLLASGGLRLVSLDSMPAEPFASDASAEQESLAPVIYRRGFQLEMAGSYFALLDYLRSLDKLPLFWESVDYRVTPSGVAQIKLKVYTLSFEKE